MTLEINQLREKI